MLVLAATLACDGGGLGPEPTDPAGRMASWLRAVHAKDCERAWQYLSRETREAAQRNSERHVRDAPYAVETYAPLRFYCASHAGNAYGALQSDPIKLISQDERRARVEVLEREPTDFRLPGFFPAGHRLVPHTLELVHEEGEWRVALAARVEPDRGWTETRRDGVVIRTLGSGRSRQLWALAGLDASIASVEEAAMDWEHWPDWIPEVRSVTRVGTAQYESDPILRVHLEGHPERVATFPFHRSVSSRKGTSFSARLRPLLDPIAPPQSGRVLRVPGADLAVYPDPEGRTRLQLIFTPPQPLPGAGAPPSPDAPSAPSPESVVRFVHALERYAAATQ